MMKPKTINQVTSLYAIGPFIASFAYHDRVPGKQLSVIVVV